MIKQKAFRNICSVCAKIFWSTSKTDICVDCLKEKQMQKLNSDIMIEQLNKEKLINCKINK